MVLAPPAPLRLNRIEELQARQRSICVSLLRGRHDPIGQCLVPVHGWECDEASDPLCLPTGCAEKLHGDVQPGAMGDQGEDLLLVTMAIPNCYLYVISCFIIFPCWANHLPQVDQFFSSWGELF